MAGPGNASTGARSAPKKTTKAAAKKSAKKSAPKKAAKKTSKRAQSSGKVYDLETFTKKYDLTVDEGRVLMKQNGCSRKDLDAAVKQLMKERVVKEPGAPPPAEPNPPAGV